MIRTQKRLASGNLVMINFVVTRNEVKLEVDYASPPTAKDKAETEKICTLASTWMKAELG